MKPTVSLIPEPDRSTEARGSMTDARKRRIHAMRKGICWMCTSPVPVLGPQVRYDHRRPLEMQGTDDDSNLWPLHREPCDRIKTAADKTAIARAKRLAGETCQGPTKPIPSRVNPWAAKGTRKLRSSFGLTRKALRHIERNEQ